MGHTDQIVICDAGYPIPNDANRIDLAFRRNNPQFFDVLDVIMEELIVEKIVIAQEVETNSPHTHHNIITRFPTIEIDKITHEQFKLVAMNSKAYIRTGECTPYANIILIAGVDF